MCGIVGAISRKDVISALIQGLKRLEYRGYDSAGLAIITMDEQLKRLRTKGKIERLKNLLETRNLQGPLGIAHTRWATHGVPSEKNAHPHVSENKVAIVHNGIIENHQKLREKLLRFRIELSSDTDSELIAHLIHLKLKQGLTLLESARQTTLEIEGSYAIGVIAVAEPNHLIALRRGSPLVIGIGDNSNYIASDSLALLPQTNQFVYLEDGDIADIYLDRFLIYDNDGNLTKRKKHIRHDEEINQSKGKYQHYMLKEIHQQPAVCERLLKTSSLGPKVEESIKKARRIQIVACGTSYHAALIGKQWFESIANLPCQVQIASEFRYSKKIVESNTLFITLSQSGETADTLAALRLAKESGYINTLTICNVVDSTLVRESDLSVITQAGPEIGVASTKALTSQLICLLLLMQAIKPTYFSDQMRLPELMRKTMKLEPIIKKIAKKFVNNNHSLFLGRGLEFPIALEGALKMKEISYIHAEAYPAGELKHGPLALIDETLPVVALAPNNELLPKIQSNLQEVASRDGKLFIFSDVESLRELKNTTLITMPAIDAALAPIIYAIPMQLLAYYVALLKRTDIDQPRNLAKSVTVE